MINGILVNVFGGVGFVYYVVVYWGLVGVVVGFYYQCVIGGEVVFVMLNGQFYKLGWVEVVVGYGVVYWFFLGLCGWVFDRCVIMIEKVCSGDVRVICQLFFVIFWWCWGEF